jgi:hypothetical protein
VNVEAAGPFGTLLIITQDITMVDGPQLDRADLLIIEVSRSLSDTPQSVGLLWTSNQPDAENST